MDRGLFFSGDQVSQVVCELLLGDCCGRIFVALSGCWCEVGGACGSLGLGELFAVLLYGFELDVVELVLLLCPDLELVGFGAFHYIIAHRVEIVVDHARPIFGRVKHRIHFSQPFREALPRLSRDTLPLLRTQLLGGVLLLDLAQAPLLVRVEVL